MVCTSCTRVDERRVAGGTGSVGKGSLSTEALPLGSIAAIVNLRLSARAVPAAVARAATPSNPTATVFARPF